MLSGAVENNACSCRQEAIVNAAATLIHTHARGRQLMLPKKVETHIRKSLNRLISHDGSCSSGHACSSMGKLHTQIIKFIRYDTFCWRSEEIQLSLRAQQHLFNKQSLPFKNQLRVTVFVGPTS